MQTTAYEITDRPGTLLCIGQQPGEERPTLYFVSKIGSEGKTLRLTLASFHGEKQARATINYLDTLIGQVQRVIDHLAGENDG